MAGDGAGAAGSRGREFCEQRGYRARFDWGPNGLRTLAPLSAVVVIVDVLRFTTAVCVAVERGAVVFPYRWHDDSAAAFALERDAVLAGRRERGELSLSPADLERRAHAGLQLVLPSPNGSALAFAARDHGAAHVLAASLRNAGAVARRAEALAGDEGVVSVIAAGERWNGPTGPLRPAVEDLIGAGAVLSRLAGPSPEADAAAGAFRDAQHRLAGTLAACASGRELIDRFGWRDDVEAAARLDVSDAVPELVGEAFVSSPAGPARSR